MEGQSEKRMTTKKRERREDEKEAKRSGVSYGSDGVCVVRAESVCTNNHKKAVRYSSYGGLG